MLHWLRCAVSSKVRLLWPCRLPHLPFGINSDLMAENHTLRGLLRSLSAFIGEGAGGVLPKLGWTLNDFENYVNRAETDTAWESFQKNKGDKQGTQAEASTSQLPSNSRKRTADDVSSNRNKRQRSSTAEEDAHTCDIGAPVLAEGNHFNDLLRTNASASPIFVTSQTATPQTTYPASGSGSVPFTPTGPGSTSSFLHGLGLDPPANDATDSVSLTLPPPRTNRATAAAVESADEEDGVYSDPKFEEAGKLIGYVEAPVLVAYGN